MVFSDRSKALWESIFGGLYHIMHGTADYVSVRMHWQVYFSKVSQHLIPVLTAILSNVEEQFSFVSFPSPDSSFLLIFPRILDE